MSPARLAVVGAGLVLALAVALGIGTALASDYLAVEWADIAAGVAVWSGPPVVSLVALRAAPPTRAGIWIGAGVTLALIAGISLSIWIPLLLVAPATLIIVAGARGPTSGSAFRVALTLTILVGAASISAGYLLQERACWDEVMGPGGSTWVKRPFSTTSTGDLDTPASLCGAFATPLSVVMAAGVWLIPAGLGLRSERVRAEATA